MTPLATPSFDVLLVIAKIARGVFVEGRTFMDHAQPAEGGLIDAKELGRRFSGYFCQLSLSSSATLRIGEIPHVDSVGNGLRAGSVRAACQT